MYLTRRPLLALRVTLARDLSRSARLRKIRPRTTCLYCSAPPRCPCGLPCRAGCLAPLGSAASMLFRSLSAVSHSFASKPKLAVES